MAVTTTQLDNLPTYTDAQMVKVCKKALVDVMAGGQSYSLNGRTVTLADLDKLKTMLAFFEDRVESASNGENIALVEFRGP